MHGLTAVIVYAAIVIFLIVVITPLRVLAAWVIKVGSRPCLEGIKAVFHVIRMSHENVIHNFQPRKKVLAQLDRGQTSYTEETQGKY